MVTPDWITASRTTTSLLDALGESGNEPAWVHIDARYRPVLTRLGRRLGLGEGEAEDVAQQTLGEFVRAYRGGRYDRSRGRLSSWILGIARNTALRAIRSHGREVAVGDTAIAAIPDEQSLRTIWDEERDREIVDRALQTLREDTSVADRTLQAFELVALRGVPAAEVAARCAMSVEQVYVARSRVTGRLRSLVESLTAAFEEDA